MNKSEVPIFRSSKILRLKNTKDKLVEIYLDSVSKIKVTKGDIVYSITIMYNSKKYFTFRVNITKDVTFILGTIYYKQRHKTYVL